MPSEEMLTIKNLFYTAKNPEDQGHTHILSDVNLKVAKGSFVTLIGPSGCGKSTLLEIVSGLLKPTRGEIENLSQQMSMVFQSFAIFPWLDVRQNIMFGLRMNGKQMKQSRALANDIIQELGLMGFEKQLPKNLSGGMRQRVGLGRALAMNPDLLLMDEPFSNLDAFTAENLRREILALWQKRKMTVVMVSHIIEEAIELSDEIVVLSKRPGTIKKIIKLDLPRPRDKRSPEFFRLYDEIEGLIEK